MPDSRLEESPSEKQDHNEDSPGKQLLSYEKFHPQEEEESEESMQVDEVSQPVNDLDCHPHELIEMHQMIGLQQMQSFKNESKVQKLPTSQIVTRS